MSGPRRSRAASRLRGAARRGWRAALLVAALALLAAGCGGVEDAARQPPPARTATAPFAPTPSDAPRPARDAPIVASLGDAITAGAPLWDPDREVQDRIRDALNPQSQYQYWAQARLNGRVRFRNCGVYGERTDEIARRLDRCARGARAIVVQGGVNDLAQDRPPAEVAGRLRAMVRRAKGRRLRVALAELLPVNEGDADLAAAIDRLNVLIRGIGRAQRVAVLPWYRALEDPRSPDRLAADMTLDGIHPSVIGYRRLGEIVAKSPPIAAVAARAGPTG